MIHCGNGVRSCQSPGLPAPEERAVIAGHRIRLRLAFVCPPNSCGGEGSEATEAEGSDMHGGGVAVWQKQGPPPSPSPAVGADALPGPF